MWDLRSKPRPVVCYLLTCKISGNRLTPIFDWPRLHYSGLLPEVFDWPRLYYSGLLPEVLIGPGCTTVDYCQKFLIGPGCTTVDYCQKFLIGPGCTTVDYCQKFFSLFKLLKCDFPVSYDHHASGMRNFAPLNFITLELGNTFYGFLLSILVNFKVLIWSQWVLVLTALHQTAFTKMPPAEIKVKITE